MITYAPRYGLESRAPTAWGVLSRGKGVSAAQWLARGTLPDSGDLDDSEAANDFTLMSSLGFKNVRIVFDPQLVSSDEAGTQRTIGSYAMITYMAQKAKLAQDAGLGVILSCMPILDASHKSDLLNNVSSHRADFASLWAAIATALISEGIHWDAIGLQLLNEPAFSNQTELNALHWQAIKSIRAIAPAATCIVHADAYARSLVSTDPAYLLGANVISSFHCYGTSDGGATSGSYGFTHQGESSAANPYLALISNLEWPANSGNITTVSSVLGQLGAVSGKATAQSYVTAYGSGETTSANLLAEIAASQSWARTYSPWTICTEFGCTSAAPAASRTAWLSAACGQFDSIGTPCWIWSFTADNFGVYSDPVLHPSVVTHLG